MQETNTTLPRLDVLGRDTSSRHSSAALRNAVHYDTSYYSNADILDQPGEKHSQKEWIKKNNIYYVFSCKVSSC